MLEEYAKKLQQFLWDNPKYLKLLAKVVNLVSKCLAIPMILVPSSKNYPYKLKKFNRLTYQKLISKQVKYLQMIRNVQDNHGFIESQEGDSLLFSGLVGSAGVRVDVEAARDEKGQWFRRPIDNPYNGASTISRDMFLGLLWYMWANKRLKLAEELFEYGKYNDWIMGQGDPGRIYFTPGLQATLAEIIYRLGGKNHWLYRNQIQVWPKSLEDYQAHLDGLHILLRGELLGYITDSMKKSLKIYHDRETVNGLFEYAHHLYKDGSQLHAAAIVLNQKWFPKDRLPTEKDRYSHWLWERKYMKNGQINPDWLPDTGDKIHSGGELIFLIYLITRL